MTQVRGSKPQFIAQLRERATAHIAEVNPFELPPNPFHGIEVGRVAR